MLYVSYHFYQISYTDRFLKYRLKIKYTFYFVCNYYHWFTSQVKRQYFKLERKERPTLAILAIWETVPQRDKHGKNWWHTLLLNFITLFIHFHNKFHNNCIVVHKHVSFKHMPSTTCFITKLKPPSFSFWPAHLVTLKVIHPITRVPINAQISMRLKTSSFGC